MSKQLLNITDYFSFIYPSEVKMVEIKNDIIYDRLNKVNIEEEKDG